MAGFGEYRVLRNVARSTEVETLAVVDAVGETRFVDATPAPNTAYEYRVSVVNASGFEVPSERQNVSGYALDGVRLLAVASDGSAGGNELVWSRYRSAGFERYRIERRVAGVEGTEVLAEVADVGDTVYVDESALSGVDYAHRMAVAAKGEELTSNGVEGRLELPAVEVVEVGGESALGSRGERADPEVRTLKDGKTAEKERGTG